MESATLIFTLLFAGIMAGAVNFFVSYLDLPFQKTSTNLLEDDWPKPKKLWLAIFGYLLVGMVGAFLTPLINVLIGLKGYYSDKDFLVAFGYGLVFGYSTTRLLVGVLDSILKRIAKIEDKVNRINEVIKVKTDYLTTLTDDLSEGDHSPANKSEVQACGAATSKIIRDDAEFKKLKENTNVDIVFKDEEGTGADRMMNTNLFNALNTLASKVKLEWRNGANPKYKLRVTEAWDEVDENGNGEHGANSLHYEARAADINLCDFSTGAVDSSHLGKLSALAIDSGFDWVFYEDSNHVHVSCKK